MVGNKIAVSIIMKIYLLDEHTFDFLGTPSLFYEIEEENLLVKEKNDNITN